ncbi:hypothetical protein LTR62_002753 [Meristemomyces frigidus]|uniref:DUF7702 domain-containing protein n=1 Tax=Meristemomyces frigidus TaxID=1508187 RepID=A0AAN7TJC5_9PEZI|nr:hypothetical protein LTR62_002753 [Meristemomyces frigidus]
MLAPKGCLAATEIAFFAPILCIGIFLLFRHGFGKKLGWLYIVLLSLLRLIGGSVTLYMNINNTFTSGLLETAAITSAIGTAPLLLALMGFLERINQNMEHEGLSTNLFRPLHLASLAALILAIIGGTDEAEGESVGRILIKVAAIIFLVIYLALVAITVRTGTLSRHVLSTEHILLRACILVLPILLIRIIYTVCASFANQGSVFYYQDVNVYISAFMQFLMEALTVSMFVFAGMLTPKMEKRSARVGSAEQLELGQQQEYEVVEERKHQKGKQQQRPGNQRPTNVWDYRPSKFIMNAINSRR